jgi:hypothetical protein
MLGMMQKQGERRKPEQQPWRQIKTLILGLDESPLKA